MLRIRAEQLSVFAKQMEMVFPQRMTVWLIDQFPDLAQPAEEPALQAKVTDALAAARSFGLDAEGDLALFLRLCVEHGWDFHENAWVREALSRTSFGSPPARLRWVLNTLAYRAAIAEQNRSMREAFLA